jgi:hypothetical protein
MAAVSASLVDNSFGISVLLGNGDGTFQAPKQRKTGEFPIGIVSGDFNGDGKPDLAVANGYDATISVLLSNGDGTFQPQEQLSLGFDPTALVTGDFNGDGRVDLAVAGINSDGTGELEILLGNGDGTFQPGQELALKGQPTSLVAGDFNGDGRGDLAVGEYGGWGGISILLGNGDGTFQPPEQFEVGVVYTGVVSLVSGDFNGDGKLDLAADVWGFTPHEGIFLVLGNGDGTFQPPKELPGGHHDFSVGEGEVSLAAGDFNGDGNLDLASIDMTTSDTKHPGIMHVFLGNGDGTFQPPRQYDVGTNPVALVAGDFNGDGKLDLAVLDQNVNDGSGDSPPGQVMLLPGNGDGTFQPARGVWMQDNLAVMLGTDLNGDGRLDLAGINWFSSTYAIALGRGDGTFVDPGQLAITPHAMPLVADVNGDGTDDVLVVDGHGNILYRQGIPGQPGTFEPPITVNPGFPARDLAWLPNTDQGPLLASVDAHDDAVSFYAYRNGGFVRLGSLATGRLPAQIIAADLNRDGPDDLVIRNAGDGTLTVYRSGGFVGPRSAGSDLPSWLPPVTLTVGLGVSDVQAVDTTGSGSLDLVVTNKLSGQVSVLHNWGDGSFAAPVPYRAGTGLSAIDPGSTPEITSLEATAGVAAGPLTTGSPTSLVTINPGSNTLDVLAGLGQGRFANPVSLQTASPAQIVRVADFNHDGIPDLAVLSANGVSIYLGNGQGGFAPPVTYDAGPDSSGLTVADVNRDGNLDLLIGNPYGDVLVLLGQGDGTFQPYHEANQAIALAVADLTGTGSKDIIYADQGLDRVVVDYGAGNTSVLGDQSTGLLAPGAVTLADLNGDGIPDLVVANSGSNNVLIYPGIGNGQFGPAVNGGHGYFVGTNPVGITVANLTGSLPDLVVADKGSNEVSILLNQGNFDFTAGPRLNAGGSGPVSTAVGDFNHDGIPDILVTNSGSNDVKLLPGVGGGFFNDTSPQTFTVGTDPVASFVGSFNGQTDLVTINAGSNDLTLIVGFDGPNPATTTIASGGTDPTTAFAFASGSGFEDLVVGNTGDGVLALFEGGRRA